MKNSEICLSFLMIIIFFLTIQLNAQRTVAEYSLNTEREYNCLPEPSSDITSYLRRDSRASTRSGRIQIINEAVHNIFLHGKYIERCGNDVGLNRFEWSEPYRQGFSLRLRANANYWNDERAKGEAYINVVFKYDQIHREENVAGKINLTLNQIDYPESGKIYDCGSYSGGLFSDDVLSSTVDPGDEDAFYIPNSHRHKYTVDCYAESDVHKGQSHTRIGIVITIYPLVFDGYGFYMEGENRWAEDMTEAVEYIVLHEFGHLEWHMYDKMNFVSYPYLDSGEVGADNFASSVWRCSEE
ncbi:hypothetical protein [Lewinella sp. LCG006]|uniref:hypothetical protein n=1 Tax=Lewinella sp. LCG006 TaxID=3231911 RepID=UPI003460CFC8